MNSFWNQIETKQISSKEQIEQYLTKQLGIPTNQLGSNCLTEITKRVLAFYKEESSKNHTIYSLVGCLTSPEQIIEKQFKEGKRRGKTFYSLKLKEPEGETLRALQENLSSDKWNKVKKFAILNQKLVFKYQKWLTNKDIIDFYPYKS